MVDVEWIKTAIDNLEYEKILGFARNMDNDLSLSGFKKIEAKTQFRSYTAYVHNHIAIEYHTHNHKTDFIISYHNFILKSSVTKPFIYPNRYKKDDLKMTELFTTRNGFPEVLSNNKYQIDELNRVFEVILNNSVQLWEKKRAEDLRLRSDKESQVKERYGHLFTRRHLDYLKERKTAHQENPLMSSYCGADKYKSLFGNMSDLNIDMESIGIFYVSPSRGGSQYGYYVCENLIFENYGRWYMVVHAVDTNDLEKIKKNVTQPLQRLMYKDVFDKQENKQAKVGELEAIRLMDYPHHESANGAEEYDFSWRKDIPELVNFARKQIDKVFDAVISRIEPEVLKQEEESRDGLKDFTKYIK